MNRAKVVERVTKRIIVKGLLRESSTLVFVAT
jgi:hypothetical protein